MNNPILATFLALYGNASSGYMITGEWDNDEPMTVTIDFPMQPSLVFECEPESDDDGFFHFLLRDTTVTILVPYPNISDVQ
jgi:hypothetical protein